MDKCDDPPREHRCSRIGKSLHNTPNWALDAEAKAPCTSVTTCLIHLRMKCENIFTEINLNILKEADDEPIFFLPCKTTTMQGERIVRLHIRQCILARHSRTSGIHSAQVPTIQQAGLQDAHHNFHIISILNYFILS